MRRRAGVSRTRAVPSSVPAALSVVLCAVLGVAGCATAPAEPDPVPETTVPQTTAPEATVPVLLEIVQLRGDVAGGFVELRVTNEGTDELVIERAAYDSSAWSTTMTRVDEARIPAGARRNLRLQLPEPTCEPGPVEHRATLELADGSVVEGEPQDPLGQLDALDDRVCDVRAFARDVAGLAWLAPDIPADGSRAAVLRLEVSPAPGGGERLGSIDDVAATVLLTPTDARGGRLEALPVALEIVAGAAPTVIEVPLAPGRCDLHAVAEDKQGTIFRIRATAAGEPVDLLVPVPDDQRDALLGWVVARCAG
ncbi:hypothetical protein [Agrococcus jenensis]|uniref:hypothetical protein n=1 Tax=Agrococcus jenensis TaxID=46353 RepID=UPI0011CD382A|nr:hypothetical protein [Agrococcus jenensis]